jgi:3'(2'), 5'-bisphosphate nucleotidase
MNEISLEVTTALQAAIMAADICRKVQQDLIGEVSFVKSDRSPVTIADYGSQAIICKLIRDRFSEDGIVAEEDSEELRKPTSAKILEQVTRYVNEVIPDSSPAEVCDWIDFSSHRPQDRFWAVDPIDGTKGFLRGDQYAVALALVEAGVVKLGLLACPNLHVDMDHPGGARGCLFLALRGKGAVQLDRWGKNRRSLSVSRISDPSEAFFTESVEMDHADHELHERVARKLNITKPPLQVDSQVKYGIVARGEAVLYLRIPAPSERTYQEKVWDHAAGMIITEEAGGKITDAFGKPLDFTSGIRLEKNYGIVVSNGILHEAVLKALHPLPGESRMKT